jgi:transcriptional regulator with XRE-family HTH domain
MNERPPIVIVSKLDELLPVIRHEMKLGGVTQNELAEHLGVAYVTANRMLNGRTAMSIEQLFKILAYLGLGVALAPPKGSAPRDAAPAPARRKTPADHGVGLGDLVAAGRVAVGDTLVSLPGSLHVQATVGEGGTVVLDGNTYTSVSTAAKAVRGGTTTNGWGFWGANGRSLDSIRKEMLAAGGS